jgi:kinesin family protein 4/21/27
MGTGYTVGGSTEGVIPKVMTMIYEKVAALKAKAEFQIRVSFIEVFITRPFENTFHI